MRIDFARRSLSDIRSLLQYIEETWGTGHVDEYRSVLAKAFDLIAEYPDIGHHTEGKPATHREFSTSHHVILYRREQERVVILRIMGHRQQRTS